VTQSDPKNIAVMHSLPGFVISTLLVFHTNTAYDGSGRLSLVGGMQSLGKPDQ